MLPALLVFAEVAKQQSFTGAAGTLGMSKSGVSQQIKRLEAYLGQQLLSRHTRGMSLTSAGHKLLTRSELLSGQVNLAFEELTSSKETPSGPFSITAPHACQKDIVVPAIKQLCIEFPKLEPSLVITDEPMDLIHNNLDVAIYAGDLRDSNYRALPIGGAAEVLVAAPGYVQQAALSTPNDLLPLHWITAPWQDEVLSIGQSNDTEAMCKLDIRPFIRTNSLPCVLDMVLENMGFALLPEFVVGAALMQGRLMRLLPSYQGRYWPFYFVHRYSREKPLHITRFYQLVGHFFTPTRLLAV